MVEAAPVNAVEMRGIVKRFPGVVANDGISFAVRKGESHALLGENGAGKSTLMNILYGIHKPDEGEILVNGQVTHFHGPRDAVNAGLGMVHQHFMLIPRFTVAENVILGSEGPGLILDRDEAERRVGELASEYGLRLDPRRRVEDLPVGMQQRVEIVRALYQGSQTLILDEPTALLTPQEVDELYIILERLRAGGGTIIFITHKLREVAAISDRVTVIRRGKAVETLTTANTSASQLAELMVGRKVSLQVERPASTPGEPLLGVRDLSVKGRGGTIAVNDLSLTVRASEIVGICGVEGNGQTELVEAVVGMVKPSAGVVELSAEDVTSWGTRERRASGVGYIPEDRHRHGLLLDAPLWENRILGHQTREPSVKGPWINRDGARTDAQRIVEEYDVRTPGIDTTARALSGGNQQKFIGGREMSGEPKLLVASHPTRGVDVGAQAAIWDHIREARRRGLAVLLISADLDELIGLSDSVKVILRGRLVGDFDPQTVTPQELGAAMTGAQTSDSAGAAPQTDVRRPVDGDAPSDLSTGGDA
jgi:simple sugar transport system ATP-binding protein